MRGFKVGTGRRLAAAIALFALSATPAAQALERVDFRVPGASQGLVDDLRSASALLESERNGTTDNEEVFAAARAEYGRLLGALYARGHYSAVIRVLIDGREAAAIAPLDAPTRIGVVEVVVEPGPAFVFSQAQVQPLAPRTVLPEGFSVGAVAGSDTIREAVTAGVDGWRGAGHAKTEVGDQSLTADHARAALAANVTLRPGPRLRFGPLAVEGQERMLVRRIEKIAGLPRGEVYSPAEIERAASRLRRTGVFRSVTITEDETVTAPDLLGLTISVVEEKLRRYSIGAEVASFEGLDLTGYWLHRNLLGGGERLKVDGGVSNIGAQSSGVDYTLGVTIDRPATLTPDTTLSFGARVSRLDEEDYRANIGSVEMTFSHIFNDDLSARVGIGYNYSNGTDLGGDFIYRNLSVPVGVIWDTRDDPVNATSGFYLEAEAKPFLGFGTTGSGARMKLDARAYRAFGAEQGLVLAGRFQAGAIFGSSLLETPRDFLFYSGGGGTVRGQPYQSLGVRASRDGGPEFKIGGTYFIGGSVEARVKVTPRIGVVGFVDAGQISAGDFFDASGDWHAGAGLGLRYDTGFGPIRVDIAAPVGGNTGDGVQFYVGLGQSF